MLAKIVLSLVRLVLIPLDVAGPSRPRLVLRRLSLRLRDPAPHPGP
ncbi:MAG TPA: hypothetical protein VFD01_17460 [Candidatus Dormibacteraeota bacterium]|jgi:hypothetical protein|nr:hypothetical protein [Candidatus Dormibacteraeota bacterium]